MGSFPLMHYLAFCSTASKPSFVSGLCSPWPRQLLPPGSCCTVLKLYPLSFTLPLPFFIRSQCESNAGHCGLGTCSVPCSPRAAEGIPFYPATAELLLEPLRRGHLHNLPVHIDTVLNLYWLDWYQKSDSAVCSLLEAPGRPLKSCSTFATLVFRYCKIWPKPWAMC